MHDRDNFIQRLSHVWKSPPATVTPFTVVLLEYSAWVKLKDATSAKNDGTAYRPMFKRVTALQVGDNVNPESAYFHLSRVKGVNIEEKVKTNTSQRGGFGNDFSTGEKGMHRWNISNAALHTIGATGVHKRSPGQGSLSRLIKF